MMHIINLDQKREWNECISKSLKFDFYHSWAYHSLDKSGDPILCVYQENEIFIALPLIRRRINNSSYYDLTSVYGYTGPVSNVSFDLMTDEFKENFKADFLEFLDHGMYVTIFSRLNPFLNQNILFDVFGGLHANGKTVAIDLNLTTEDRRAGYRRGYTSAIKKLKARGFLFKEGGSEDEIRKFAGIYRENMIRIGASKSYWFEDEYFLKLLRNDDYTSKLFMIYFQGQPIAGAIAMFTHGIMQIYFLATKTEFLKFSPAKFIIDEAAIIGQKLNMRYCHLGGGLGFTEDQLFDWKCGFSKHILDYYSWRYVINEEVYNQLSSENVREEYPPVDFFPLYRYVSQLTSIYTTGIFSLFSIL